MARERLYGLTEIATALGKKAGTLSAWQTRGTNDIPPPDQRLGSGPVWFASTIEPWIASQTEGGRPPAPALREDLLRQILRRHLRATALLIEGPPRRPALIAHALRDLEDVREECARAASEARGPLAKTLRAEGGLIADLHDVRRRTEAQMPRAGSQRRRQHAVSPELDRAHDRLAARLMMATAPLSAAIAEWLEGNARDGAT